MSSTHIVRSAIEGYRRKSRSSFATAQLGNMSSIQTKSQSDDDEEDDDMGTIPEVQNVSKRRVSSTAMGDEGRLENVRKASAVVEPDTLYSPLSRSEGESTGEDILEHIGRPWYFQVSKHIVNWTIDPDGFLYFYWKAILTLAVMYNYVVIILRVAFEEMRNEPIFHLLDYLSDFIYLVDFVVESKTRYLSNGCLIYDSRLTFQNYLVKNTIMCDGIAVIPVNIIFTTATGLCNIFGFPLAQVQNNYAVIEPALRLNRLAKSHVMNTFFYKTESRTNNPNFLRGLRLSIQLSLVIHWIACLYYMISEYEGLGSTEWAYPSDAEYNMFQRKYIICMYWSIMTLTTIGERPSPVSNLEYIFTGWIFLIGVFVFAAVVGNVGEVISNMNAARRDFQTRMDQIKFYLNHRQVPEALQTRIKRWAEYTWDRTKAVDEPSVLQWLPERLRTEVAIYVHLSVLKKVSMFAECEEGLLTELVLKLKPQIYSPGDYICRIGEIGREMYIINHGQVEILFPNAETGAMRQVAVMNPGNFFGEISLLKLDDGQNKRTADVRSIGFSELLCLSRRDLMVALTEYPEAKRILEEYARERFQQTKKHSKSREGSSDNSPRESLTSNPSPTSARQVFARVMRKEGFANLLKRKDTDLMAIKAAVEELKATKSTEVHQTFVLLHKEIQDMNGMLLHKDFEMQEAKAEVAYLKSVIRSHSLNEDRRENGKPNKIGTDGDENTMNSHSNFQFPERHDVNSPTIHSQKSLPNSNGDYQRYRNRFYSDQDHLLKNPIDTSTMDQHHSIPFQDIPCDEVSPEQNLDKSSDIDSSFNSSEEDSCDEMVSIEKKFDKIGRDGIYMPSNRWHSSLSKLNILSQTTDYNLQTTRRNSDNSNFHLHSPENDTGHHKSMDSLLQKQQPL